MIAWAMGMLAQIKVLILLGLGVLAVWAIAQTFHRSRVGDRNLLTCDPAIRAQQPDELRAQLAVRAEDDRLYCASPGSSCLATPPCCWSNVVMSASAAGRPTRNP